MFNIKDFLAEIQTSGVMRSNRFEVKFVRPPAYVTSNIAQTTLRCDAVQLPGLSFASIDGPPRPGYGPIESTPFSVAFDDITLTFIVDARGDVHKFFYDWFNTIVNFKSQGQKKLKDAHALGADKEMRAFEVGYKDDYMSDIEITVFDTADNRKVLTAKVFRAFPKVLSSVDLSWGADSEVVRLSIPFSYTDFNVTYHNAITKPITT